MIAFPKKKRRAYKWSADMAVNSPGEVERLVRENFRMVFWFARHHARKLIGDDAAVSVATDGLLRAAQTYDPSRCTKFSTHTFQYMRGFMSHERKRQSAVKRGAWAMRISIDCPTIRHELGVDPWEAMT